MAQIKDLVGISVDEILAEIGVEQTNGNCTVCVDMNMDMIESARKDGRSLNNVGWPVRPGVIEIGKDYLCQDCYEQAKEYGMIGGAN